MSLYTLENVESFRGMDVTNGEIDAYDAYDESLDEAGMVEVAGMEFYPSQIIKELDPTAYRCGYNDWVDEYQNDLVDALENGNYSDIVWIEDLDIEDDEDDEDDE